MGFFRKANLPYKSLLLSFVLLMLLPGLVEGQFWAGRLFDISLFAVFIFGAHTARADKRIFAVLVVLAILAVAAKGLLLFFEQPALATTYLLAGGLFMLIIILVMSRHVFLAKNINDNIIYGAICIYFFVGILFAIIYVALDNISPQSFSLPTEVFANTAENEMLADLRALFYYSFVTQTTLGYGDITPVLPLARNLAILQAIAGQMYIAIVIARLIGVYLVQKK